MAFYREFAEQQSEAPLEYVANSFSLLYSLYVYHVLNAFEESHSCGN